MERPGAPSGPRRAVLAAGLAVAAVVLVGVVATSASIPLATEGSGGWHLDRRPRSASDRPTVLERPVGLPERSQMPGDGVVAVLGELAVIVAASTFVVLVGRTILRLSRRPSEPFEQSPPEHWPTPGRAMVDALDEGLAAVRSGPADDVIVACWVRLEDAADAAGVARDPAETSSELAGRVLRDLDAPEPAIDALLDRYRRARFSHHRLDEEDRLVAIRSLEEIRAAIDGSRVNEGSR